MKLLTLVDSILRKIHENFLKKNLKDFKFKLILKRRNGQDGESDSRQPG